MQHENRPTDALLVAIDIAKIRNEVLIEGIRPPRAAAGPDVG
jgi:hypothetical protein